MKNTCPSYHAVDHKADDAVCHVVDHEADDAVGLAVDFAVRRYLVPIGLDNFRSFMLESSLT